MQDTIKSIIQKTDLFIIVNSIEQAKNVILKIQNSINNSSIEDFTETHNRNNIKFLTCNIKTKSNFEENGHKILRIKGTFNKNDKRTSNKISFYYNIYNYNTDEEIKIFLSYGFPIYKKYLYTYEKFMKLNSGIRNEEGPLITDTKLTNLIPASVINEENIFDEMVMGIQRSREREARHSQQ